jgi:ABC-type Fe3+-hydroxamate transport system substrate-binding protein
VRVVSLVPSVTETLLAWGVTPVACTRFCEQPLLAHVGGTKDPDLDAIVALKPDLVVVDEEENRKPDAEALRAAGVPLHVTAVRSVIDVPVMARDLAAAVGVRAEPIEIEAKWYPLPLPRLFVPIWKRPWMTINADTYGSSVLAWAGGDNLFASAPDRYPEVEMAAVVAQQPDLVLLPSEPYPFAERHRNDVIATGARVVLVDGRDLFWWGVRTPGALDRLWKILRAR